MKTDSESSIATLKTLVPSLMRQFSIPGLSIALLRDGRTVWTQGFGVRERPSPGPVTASTVFEGASFSKPLFAYGVLRLVKGGVLDLDVPLIRYLSDESFCEAPGADQITARMVLSHTTGFPNWRRSGGPLTLDRMPGEAFGYSGEGYVYLQQVVERLTGQPLQEYVQRSVLAPLGLTQSSYVWSSSYISTAATGHKSDGTPYPKDRPSGANAAHSLHTTPRDFARFLEHILSASNHRPEASDVDVAAMLAPQVCVKGNLWWGLGWGLQHEAQDEIIWHWGDNPGFTSFTAARRQQRSGVVIMTNSDNGLRVWDTIAQCALGLDTEVFDWLAQTFYEGRHLGEAKARSPQCDK